MNGFLLSFIFVVLAYFLGAFPTAFIIGKFFTHLDIRKEGSGNVGATNVLRVLGVAPGLITLIVDMAKGFIVVWAGNRLINSPQFFGEGFKEGLKFLPFLSGLSAVIGHNWNIFLKFKGGKGVAVTLGVCLFFYPKAALAIILIWFLVLSFSRYVSLSSLTAALTLPFFIWLYFNRGTPADLILQVIYGLILALLIVWRHQGNIKRLFHHQERKLNFLKSG